MSELDLKIDILKYRPDLKIKIDILKSILPSEVKLTDSDLGHRVSELMLLSQNNYLELRNCFNYYCYVHNNNIGLRDGFDYYCCQHKEITDLKIMWNSYSLEQKKIYVNQAKEFYDLKHKHMTVTGFQLYFTIMRPITEFERLDILMNDDWNNLGTEAQQNWIDAAKQLDNLWVN